jgi:hypothetical protein
VKKKHCIGYVHGKCSKCPPSAWMYILTRLTRESASVRRTTLETRVAALKICWRSSSRVHLAFTHHVIHVIPHIVIQRSEIRRPRRPILHTAAADASIRELLIQILRDIPAEMWGCPAILVVHLQLCSQRNVL